MPAVKPAAAADAPATTDAAPAPASEPVSAPAGEWKPLTVRYVVSDREQYSYATLVTQPQPPNGAGDISFTNPQGSAGFAPAVPHFSEAAAGQPYWQGYDG